MDFLKPPLVLLVVTMVSALVIGVLYDITREPILQQQIIRERETVASLLPGTFNVDEEFIEDEESAVIKVITGYTEQDEMVGYTVIASSRGYAGVVEVMVGFDLDGNVTGVKVLQQTETPGLGTAILNQSFLDQFEGRTQQMTVVRTTPGADEIQALSSATISTVAVVEGINAAMEYMKGWLS